MVRHAGPDPWQKSQSGPSRRVIPSWQTLEVADCPHNEVFGTFRFSQKGLLKFLFPFSFSTYSAHTILKSRKEKCLENGSVNLIEIPH